MIAEQLTHEELTRQVAELHTQLAEGNEILRAIRSGEVDAVLAQGPCGDQLFTLKGADDPYRVLIEEMNQGAVTLSADGLILYCNRRFGELLGTPLEKIVGYAFDGFVAPSERAAFAALLETGRSGASAGEVTLCAADETPVPLQLALSPLPVVSAAAICLIATDISESRGTMDRLVETEQVLNADLLHQAAQLLESNRELEAFSYSVSHDLRAPLRHVLGYVDMLVNAVGSGLPEKPRRYLDTIRAATEEMGQLIDALLAFSKAGRTDLNSTEIAMDELVREVIRDLDIETADRDIVWDIAPLSHVDGDRAMLKQVFANLIGNSVKYTRGRAPATIRIGCNPEEGGHVVFFVRDNGAGFDMRYVKKLFGVFQRLHREDEFEGTGIGLANVRRIVARHGGQTWAEGEPGRGATFSFSLKPSNIQPEKPATS